MQQALTIYVCFARCFTSCVLLMQTLWVDPYNGLKTHQNDIIFDRGMSFEAACRKLEHEKGAEDASGFRRSRRPIFGRTMFLLAVQKVGTPGVFSICRPNTGTSFFDMEVQLPSCVLQLMCSVLCLLELQKTAVSSICCSSGPCIGPPCL